MSNNECSSNEYSDKAWHNEDVLRELYLEEQWTMAEIGDRLGCHRNTIRDWMDKFGIERREKGVRPRDEKPYRDKDTLERLFCSERLTVAEIADRLDAGERTIVTWISKHGIERDKPWKDADRFRELYYDRDLTVDEVARELECDPTTVTRYADIYDLDRRSDMVSVGESDDEDGQLDIELRESGTRLESAPWRDPDKLRELYVENEMTLLEVGDELGCSPHAISDWLDRHGIPTRTPTDYAAGSPWRDEEILRQLYVERGMGMGEIADELGCGKATVQKNLYRHEIPTRELGGHDPNADYRNKEILEKYYIEEGLSIAATARKTGGSTANVRRWLIRHGLHESEYRSHTLTTHIRKWLGDESWATQAQRLVSERGDVCEMCGDESIENYRSVSAHHVVPIMAGGANFDECIILLCDSCHVKAENYANKYTSFPIHKFIRSECLVDATPSNSTAEFQ